MLLVLLTTLIVLIVLIHKIRSYYWENRHVPGPKPWPFVGNIAEHIFGRKTLGQVLMKIYRKYDGYPFVGVFRAMTPCLLIRDPDFVNEIAVKNHKAFYNNDFFIDKKNDPIMGQNPFVLRDQEWKETRQLITPGFTSGKMKQMYPTTFKVSEELVRFVANHPDNAIEIQDLTRRYTMENVFRLAFGIEGKGFDSYVERSEFMNIAIKLLEPGSLNGILQQLNAVVPFLGRFLRVRLVSEEIERKLTDIVSDVKKYRELNQVKGNDYFEFILQIAKEKSLNITEIAAHGVMFFFDGYESSAIVFTDLLFNLAMNPKYQRKIRDEIKRIEKENQGNPITYEELSEMKWLDACLYESLRTRPFLDILVKCCTQPFEYTPSNPKFKKMTVKLYPGDTVILPYSMFMKDESYFKNPDVFYPERMMDNENLNKSIFFPFGNGPRICIGQRFGLMQLKIGAAQLIKNFDISLSSKTKLPLKLNLFHFLNVPQDKVLLEFKKVNEE
ncbi:hypothetical protein ABEB36_002229 [Hypothenemus hampei]|uniref:Cytochrome P450 n=1 Tax=Hypothenemus hampei TaxID=57062 RepID=A0ABD1F4Z2_HYPHA